MVTTLLQTTRSQQQQPEITSSKEGVTSGFLCFPGEVVPDCVGGDLRGRVLVLEGNFEPDVILGKGRPCLASLATRLSNHSEVVRVLSCPVIRLFTI